MSLQSRFVGCGEGESGEKNSCGDTLPLVKRTADAKLVRDLAKHRRASRSPFGKFFSSFPGQVVDGTEDSGKVLPRPPASGADCLFRQVRGRYRRSHYVVVNDLLFEVVSGWIRR